VLRDLGYVSVSEPFPKLFNQGMLHKDGFVMSKSRGNVVVPEQVSEKYGIDTARFFLVSLATPDKDREWSDAGITGSTRFVSRFVEYVENVKKGVSSKRIQHFVNKAVKEITEDIEQMRYNLATIKLRELLDHVAAEQEISKEDLKIIIKLIAPFCPHLAEELWEKTGNKSFVSLESWPKCDEKKIDENIEKRETALQNTITDIIKILEFLKQKQNKEAKKIYLYALPNEKGWYEAKTLEKHVNKEISVFAMNDKNKHDPQNKASKAKPGKPAIYVE